MVTQMTTNFLYISTTEAGSGKALIFWGMMALFLKKTPNAGSFRPVIKDLPADQLDEMIALNSFQFTDERPEEALSGYKERGI